MILSRPRNESPGHVPSPKVSVVRYLNTAPLVWGMAHGPQQGLFELVYETPAACADHLASGAADIGIVPVVEVPKLGLEVIPGTSIACRGKVRSILLVSKSPVSEIETLAADVSSRTSVALARIILAERYGVEPRFLSAEPDLEQMLATAGAALIIGDPALRINPAGLPYRVLDLGEEWTAWTGKPMVFAVWAGRPGIGAERYEEVFRASAAYGLERIGEIVTREAPRRGISEKLAREYLTRHVIFELGEKEKEGMKLFLEYVRRGVVA